MSTDDKQRGWLTRTLLPGGEEPDPRFTLANERTFLAWVRTSLALLAGGITIGAVDFGSLSPTLQKAGSITACGAASLVAIVAFARWVRTERALRDDRPLSVPILALPLTLLVVLVCVAVVVIFA